jgi:hypothetical protein
VITVSIETEELASRLYDELEACVTEIVEDISYGGYDVDDDTAFFELARAWIDYGNGDSAVVWNDALKWEFSRITGLLSDFEYENRVLERRR